MPETIDRTTAVINTAQGENAGITARVHLGIGGREFRLHTQDDGFAPGVVRRFVLGQGANIAFPTGNDPRAPNSTSTNSTTCRSTCAWPPPVRRTTGDWRLERADATVHSPVHTYTYTALADPGSKLGLDHGLVVHLTQ